MKMEWPKQPKTTAEVRCHNELVDMIHRGVNSGMFVLEKNDTIPNRIEMPETPVHPICQCGNDDLGRMGLIYYDRVSRGFYGIGRGGVAIVNDDYDTNSLDKDDPKQAALAGYWIACYGCKTEWKWEGEIEF